MLNETLQTEIAGRLATMYVRGAITRESGDQLLAAADALPASVHVLSVCIDDYAQIAGAGMRAMRALHKHWRASRKGAFRLAFAREGVVYSLTVGEVRTNPHGNLRTPT